MTLRRKMLTAAANPALLPLDWMMFCNGVLDVVIAAVLVIQLHIEVTSLVSGAYRGIFASLFRSKPVETEA
jgi:hypothetical protein